jgi:hypothetical protein
MKRLLALLSIAALCLMVPVRAPRADDGSCEKCKAEVVESCTDKAKQHDWKKKKLNQCLSAGQDLQG